MELKKPNNKKNKKHVLTSFGCRENVRNQTTLQNTVQQSFAFVLLGYSLTLSLPNEECRERKRKKAKVNYVV